MHTPLMLQTVLGLDADRIAHAFLVPPKTMGQRLFRAKTKIRDGGIQFEIPQQRDLPERLDAVLEAIYAAFGISWDDMFGIDPRRRDLAEEAIWLARVLLQLMPSEAEVQGLLALMLHSESRRSARRALDGRYVPASEAWLSLPAFSPQLKPKSEHKPCIISSLLSFGFLPPPDVEIAPPCPSSIQRRLSGHASPPE